MPNSYSVAQVYEEVRAMLGGSQITVELETGDLNVCLASAVRVYNRNRPRRGMDVLQLSTAKKKYGPLNHPGLQGVVDVDFVTTRASTAVDPFDYVQNSVQKIIQGNGQTYGDFQQQLGSLEDATRVASAEPEWRGMQERDGYYLYVDVVRAPISCSYTYTWHVTPTDNAVTGIQFIDEGDMDWIIKYTIARAKQILARVLGKFSGIATTEGGNDPTDADTLRSEGVEEQRNLEEEILKRRRPLPPVIE